MSENNQQVSFPPETSSLPRPLDPEEATLETLSPVIKSLIKTGVLDKANLRLFQHWELIPVGAEKLAPADDPRLKASKETLINLAETIGTAYDKERTRRETYLDLSRLRWPVEVRIFRSENDAVGVTVHPLTDHLGRLYFHMSSVKKEWLIPGMELRRTVEDLDNPGLRKQVVEQIHQVTILAIGNDPICIQVSTVPL